ncbi:MAG TPA: ABC transporter permease [Micromonosporaceae bacterium]|nr:ABC transporter permease [Micromonosporaceae bacterium]
MTTSTTPTPRVDFGALPPASARQVIGLVAKRELQTRLKSKAFRIATVISVLILVALAIIAKLVSGSSSSVVTVGVTPATTALGQQLVAAAKTVDQTVHTQPVPDDATGRAEVRSGNLDGLLVGDGNSVSVVVKTDVDSDMQSALQVLAGEVALNQQITSLGGNPATVGAAIASAKVAVDPLEPPPAKPQSQQIALGIIAGILIYISLMMSGQLVAQGVVEEKSSRVVELLLATVRPWQLMAGKVLGIGLVGLTQVLIIGLSGVAVGFATGSLSIPASVAASTIVWLLAWFVLGFSAYALAFAAVGALVSRQEDVASTVTPVLMFLVIGYVLGVSILPSSPHSPFMAVLSMIPLFAPTMMPMRIAMTGVPAWQLAIALAGMIVVIPLLVWLSGRIYRNAVVRSGARVRLSDAWRPA